MNNERSVNEFSSMKITKQTHEDDRHLVSTLFVFNMCRPQAKFLYFAAVLGESALSKIGGIFKNCEISGGNRA